MATIRPAAPTDLDALTELLTSCVRAGAALGFLDTLTDDDARQFWVIALEQEALGNRVILVAVDGSAIVGTITVLLAFPANQPHRGEIAKLMVAPDRQSTGLGALLLDAGEGLAWSRGKTLLVLDTEAGSPAEGFYARHGWNKTGEIPDFALTAAGRIHPVSVYWKRGPGGSTPVLSDSGQGA
jgi:GNAT superfamily N-acetyltransferase